MKQLALILISILFSSISPIQAQIEVFECHEHIDYTGDPDNSTLCATYGNSPNFIILGPGVIYTSTLGISLINQYIYITHDIIVDNDFEFIDCVFKIDPGIKIEVIESINLKINNSKFFCCVDFWKGIKMNDNSYIQSFNGSHIEDATQAMYSINKQYGTIELESTIFNRNKVGLHLETLPSLPTIPPSIHPTVRVSLFSNNSFLSTSALNDGTLNSDCGISLINVPFINRPRSWNYFKDQKYAIKANGVINFISTRLLYCEDNVLGGIDQYSGTSIIEDSRFIDSGGNVFRNRYSHKTIIKDCHFETTQFPKYTTNWISKAVLIEGLALSSELKITNCTFKMKTDFTSKDQIFTGIEISGPNINQNCTTEISDCDFDMIFSEGGAIFYKGIFRKSTSHDIFSNTFKLRANSSGQGYGIALIEGEKNNFIIENNTFRNNWPPKFSGISILSSIQGVYLSDNSTGENINVRTNTFKTRLNQWPIYMINGITIKDFANSLICENLFENCCRPNIRAQGINNNTQLIQNQMYGNALLKIDEDSYIGEQIINGNQWYPIVVGTFGLEYCDSLNLWMRPLLYSRLWAECTNCDLIQASLSKFDVQDEQNKNRLLGCPYLPFSPFHPDSIKPDVNDEFFKKVSGTQQFCLTESPLLQSSYVFDSIANGSISQIIQQPLSAYYSNLQLYHLIRQNPDLLQYPSYNTFFNDLKNTELGTIIQIEEDIDSVFNQEDSLYVSIIENVHGSIDSFWATYEIIDNIYSDTNSIDFDNPSLYDDLLSLQDSISQYNFDLQTLIDSSLNHLSSGLLPILNSLVTISLGDSILDNEKEMYILYLKIILDVTITESEQLLIENIASLCSREDGRSVLLARIMNHCENYMNIEYYNNCYDTSFVVDSGYIAPGVDEGGSGNIVTANPDEQVDNLVFPSNYDKYQVYSVDGRLILTGKTSNMEKLIHELNNYQDGIYFLKFEKDGHIYFNKLFNHGHY